MKHDMTMKKILSLGLASLLAGLLLAGCLSEDSGLQGGGSLPPASASGPSSVAPQPTGPLRVLLPAGQGELAGLLEAAATAAGQEIEIENPLSGGYYTQEAQASLQGEQPPDLVWVNNQAEYMDLGGEDWFLDMAGQSAPVQLRALAETVPNKMRYGEENKVMALPVGYTAQGYLVNMDLLAALLNAQNQQVLLQDLLACSYKQWRMLVISLEQYLQKPGRIQVTLGENQYITPALRPPQARGLRGMFALADADADALVQGVFTAAMNPAFSENLSILQADEAERTLLLYPMLGCWLSHLEFETRHMTRREGVVFRGAAYAETWEALDVEAAQALFAEGTALFLRADAHTGLQLEAADPALEGALALVPIKLPLLAQEEAADGEQATEAEETVDVMLELAKHNRRLWVAGGGGFCLVKNSPNQQGAAALLLQLFSTKAGYEGLLGLGLVPFAPFIVSTSQLQNQVLQAVAGNTGALLPVQPAGWARAQTITGEYVRDELMDKDEWQAPQIDGFFSIATAALGLRPETVPELEDGQPLEFEEPEPAPDPAPDTAETPGQSDPTPQEPDSTAE